MDYIVIYSIVGIIVAIIMGAISKHISMKTKAMWEVLPGVSGWA